MNRTARALIALASSVVLLCGTAATLLGQQIPIGEITLQRKYSIKNYADLAMVDAHGAQRRFKTEEEAYKAIVEVLRVPANEDVVVIGYTEGKQNGVLIIRGTREKIAEYIQAQSKKTIAPPPSRRTYSDGERANGRVQARQDIEKINQAGKATPASTLRNLIAHYSIAASKGVDSDLSKQLVTMLARLR